MWKITAVRGDLLPLEGEFFATDDRAPRPQADDPPEAVRERAPSGVGELLSEGALRHGRGGRGGAGQA
jgi:hypothetical protein